MKNEKNNRGVVLEIQRMSTEDGPGLRTTVFFKGCPLSCQWCHNPESISSKPEVQWIASRCIGCGICLSVCPNNALRSEEGLIAIDREKCAGCGTCADECPSTAMELLGREWEVEDLFNELIKDRSYFDKSGGGVTVSGGEPTMQPHFVMELLKKLREEGIHTALDTCGLCSIKSLELLLPYADLVLFDLKEINPERHAEYTGASNKTILENIMFIKNYMLSHIIPKKIWIRTPVIPGKTDSDENIAGIGTFIRNFTGDIVERWELCSFNNLCRDKYIRLGKEWALDKAELITQERMSEISAIAESSGVNPGIIRWSGSARLEEADDTEANPKPQVKIKNCY